MPISELSAPQRIGDLRRKQGSGRGILGPLGCLWSKTHLSLRKSGEETLESDIHPLFASPPPAVLEMLCMTATATQLAGSPLSLPLSLGLSLLLPGGEYQCCSGLADIHTKPTPFNEVRQLRAPCREEGDTNCEGENRKDEAVADSPY